MGDVAEPSYNQRTLATYNKAAKKYFKHSEKKPSGAFLAWFRKLLAALPPDGHILEIGSGFGRDADYFEAQGYRVERSDAAQAFIEYQTKQGKQIRKCDILKDDLMGKYDMVFANGVLLHFTPSELGQILPKIGLVLDPNGLLAFSVKKGDGQGWSSEPLDEPRYFQYWQAAELRQLVSQYYQNVIVSEITDLRQRQWLIVSANSPKHDTTK